MFIAMNKFKLLKQFINEALWHVSPPKSLKDVLKPVDIEANTKLDAARKASDDWLKKNNKKIDPFSVSIEKVVNDDDDKNTITIWYDEAGNMKHSVYDAGFNSNSIIRDGTGHALNLSSLNPTQVRKLFKNFDISSIEYYNGRLGNDDEMSRGDLKTGVYSVNEYINWLKSL